jgi:hypothetical protein
MESRNPQDAFRRYPGAGFQGTTWGWPHVRAEFSRPTLLGTIRRTSIFKTRLWRQRKLRLRVGRTLKRYLKEGPS